jgi:tetratricopeptide (TPR) repeat protein
MPPPLLTATVVARNHARLVDAAIASVRPLADEIVVVDAGSTDAGAEAARAAGARVVAWSDGDDLAGARNRGLEAARGDWVLVLDADEVVRPLPAATLREALRDHAGPAADVEVHPHPAATPYRAPRLVRRASGLRFHGAVNPTLPAVDRRVEPAPLVVEGRGYDRPHRPGRAEALRRRLSALGPERVVDWCHLARIHASRGETEDAGAAWERAVMAARSRMRPHAADGLAYAGAIRSRLDRGQDARALTAEARAALPDDPELAFLAALAAMRAGAVDETIVLLEALLTDGPPTGARARPYDLRLFSLWPHAALGHCRLLQGRHVESLRHFEQAAALDPWSAEYRVKAHLAAARAGRRATVSLPSASAPRPHVFVHIPKTAGLAVNDILDRNEAPGGLAHYWDDVPDADLPRLRTAGTISGHFPWGLHARLGRPCTYVTFLREPLERLLSHYAYHRDNPGDPWHHVAATSSIVEWADRMPNAQNVQVQLVAGRRGAPTVDTLKTAMRNLPGFAVVGLTGRFEESVVVMARRLGLARPHARVVNEGRSRIYPETLPRSTRRALDKHIALDRELYALAEEIFAERLAALGPGLRADVAALRAWDGGSPVESPAGAYA